ncbi:hypothetical protein NLY39_23585 (plasmid) [Pseudomonas sp. KHPS1]|nr:hypothetical protein [Pseudomonas sp. KHPS1]UTH38975.1 hypothetical protein NLY39_23585 [Pseudomonas sp. KHPS1]
MHISKATLIGYANKVASINPLAIAVQLLVTLPAIGVIVIAAIISFIAPPASGFNTIPRMAAEFVYEKTKTPASTANHIVFFRCDDPAPTEKLPKPVKCENLVKEEMPLDKVTIAFGNLALIGYAFSWFIGFLMFGVYKLILPSFANLIFPRQIFSR